VANIPESFEHLLHLPLEQLTHSLWISLQALHYLVDSTSSNPLLQLSLSHLSLDKAQELQLSGQGAQVKAPTF
jgi:hypothetical protein